MTDLPSQQQADAMLGESHAAIEASVPARLWQLVSRRRSFLSTVSVAFATVGLQLAQGILLARLLGPHGRGEYATAVFWSHFLMFIGLFGGIELICRYANDNSYDRQQLRRSALWLGIVTGVATTVLAMLGSIFLIPSSKSYMAAIGCLCSLSVLAQNVILIMTGVDRGSGAFGLYNLRRIFAAAALPVLILVCYPFMAMNVGIVCLLYVIGSYITMWVCLKGVDHPLTGPTAVPTRRLLKEARPYALSMLAADLFERLDLCLVLWLAPIVSQGYYATMVPVVYPLIVIPNTLGMYLFNTGAKTDSTLSESHFLKTLLGLLGVQTMMVIGFWIVIRPFIVTFYGPEFDAAVAVAMWLAPASAIKGIVQGLESFLRGRGRPQASILCRVVAAGVLVVVTLALFGRYDIQAVAMAALASQLVCLLWIGFLVLRDVRSPKSLTI